MHMDKSERKSNIKLAIMLAIILGVDVVAIGINERALKTQKRPLPNIEDLSANKTQKPQGNIMNWLVAQGEAKPYGA